MEIDGIELRDDTLTSDDGEEVKTQSHDWYVIHSYSGYENKVKKNLKSRIESMGMGDRIFDVIVPTEEQPTEDSQGENEDEGEAAPTPTPTTAPEPAPLAALPSVFTWLA